MFKRNLAIVAVTLFAAVSAPAFAGDAIGSDVDGVLNPNGKEVAQTAQGVGTALGYEAWYVQGSGVRVITPTLAAEHPTPVLERRLDTGDSYAVPAFGFQAGA